MPGENDDFTGRNCFILTNPSQGRYHLYGNDPTEIRIDDIAGAISRQCRFTGHLLDDYWYSVAEHSTLVADIVCALGGSKFEQFCGLMHDTPEAYLSDIAAPFKRELGQYYEKEDLIWKRIATRFNLPENLPPIVKLADWYALFIEARQFVVKDIATCHAWVGWNEHGEAAMKLKVPLPQGLDHVRARRAFRYAYDLLSRDIVDA